MITKVIFKENKGETFLVNLAGAALASVPYVFNVEYFKIK